jgi:ATP-dependent RNA helicase SUPV3L1/SUV3
VRAENRGPRRDDRFKGGKPGGGGKGGSRGGDRDQPREWIERPVREKAPDPNSPFAKLLALKAELEAKQKG